jgi:hypothetical protein
VQFEGRANNNNWCKCGNCPAMTTDTESFCCTESTMIDEVRGTSVCITEHNSFEATVINMDSLNASRHDLMILSKDAEVRRKLRTMKNAMWRYVAYRKFVSWINAWTTMGRHNRIVIPACAVKEIRESYPESSGIYTGFETSVPGEMPEYPA